jgi:hypothetical protein
MYCMPANPLVKLGREQVSLYDICGSRGRAGMGNEIRRLRHHNEARASAGIRPAGYRRADTLRPYPKGQLSIRVRSGGRPGV